MAGRLLSKELELFACDWDPAEFRDLLQEMLAVMFPAWSRDEMLCNPTTGGVPYCEAVRRRVNASLPDNLILRTLLNTRKHQGAYEADG